MAGSLYGNPDALRLTWYGTALGLMLMFAGPGLSSFSAPLTGVLAFGLQFALSRRQATTVMTPTL